MEYYKGQILISDQRINIIKIIDPNNFLCEHLHNTNDEPLETDLKTWDCTHNWKEIKGYETPLYKALNDVRSW